MASLLDSLLGQQNTPDFSFPYQGDWLNSILGSAPRIAQGTVDYNSILQPGLAKDYLAAEKIYDPNRANIRGAAGSLLSSELQNPYALPPQLLSLMRQQGLEGAAGSGLNFSDAQRAGLFGMMGTKAYGAGQNIINQGLGYGSNTAGVAPPQSLGITPADTGNFMLGRANQQNQWNAYRSNLDYQNSMNLINRPLQIQGQLMGQAGQGAGVAASAGGGSSL